MIRAGEGIEEGTIVCAQVAFGFAGGRSETVGKTVASVPSAIRVGSPSVVTLDAPGLKRREAGYHI